jgi:hypothetical protein
VTARSWDVFPLASEDSERDDWSEIACAPWQAPAGECGACLESTRPQLRAAQSPAMLLVAKLGPGQGQNFAPGSPGKTIECIKIDNWREGAPPMDGRSNR